MNSPDLAQALVTVATILGIPGVLALVVRGVFQQVSGRAGRERARNSDYLARSIRDSERADSEAAKRRQALEYASTLRRMLLENGIDPGGYPEGLDRTLTPAEKRKLRAKPKEKP